MAERIKDIEQRIAALKEKPLGYLELAKEIMDNYPEASTDSLVCSDYDYQAGVFKFIEDDESGSDVEIEHTVTHSDIAKGLELWNLMIQHGENPSNTAPDGFFDASMWDSELIDIALQMTLFGGLVYS